MDKTLLTEAQQRRLTGWRRFKAMRAETPEEICDFRICQAVGKQMKISPSTVWDWVNRFKSGIYKEY